MLEGLIPRLFLQVYCKSMEDATGRMETKYFSISGGMIFTGLLSTILFCISCLCLCSPFWIGT